MPGKQPPAEKKNKNGVASKMLHKRAGIEIPVARVRREMRHHVGSQKTSKRAFVLTAAYVNHLLSQTLRDADKESIAQKENSIKAIHFKRALNKPENPLYGLFPKHIAGLSLVE